MWSTIPIPAAPALVIVGGIDPVQETADVTIALTSSDVTEGAVTPTALAFTTANWNAAQTVTATGVDSGTLVVVGGAAAAGGTMGQFVFVPFSQTMIPSSKKG